jgi:hypothetical protein
MVQIPKRKRGAPKGNRNRWKHGRYSRATLEKQATLKARVNVLITRCNHAIALASLIADGQAAWAAALRADADALAQMPVAGRKARTAQARKKRVPERSVISPAAPARRRCRAGRLGILIAAKRPMRMVPRREVALLRHFKPLAKGAGQLGPFEMVR